MSAPAFQFYPADFLVGTADMSPEEVGAYIRLLCYQWAKEGLPNDQAKCASMAGCSTDAMASIWHKFGICQDGKIRNERLEEVRADQQAFREKQAKNAAKRWANREKSPETVIPEGMPGHMPNACPSPSSDINNNNTARKPRKAPQPILLDDEWLTQLQAMEAYAAINVRVELGKAHVWCEVNNKVCTKRFFTNWLNRTYTQTRAISSTHAKTNSGAAPVSPHNANLNRSAVADYGKIRKRVGLGLGSDGQGNASGDPGAGGNAA